VPSCRQHPGGRPAATSSATPWITAEQLGDQVERQLGAGLQGVAAGARDRIELPSSDANGA
jgi:hypothetical protein